MRNIFLLGFLFSLSVSTSAQLPVDAQLPVGTMPLKRNWRLQSSDKIKEQGDIISTTGFRTSGWYPTKVPSTVLAALVENKIYPDPSFGMNLRSIPGCTYPIGRNFEHLPMPVDSPFRNSWWYRTEFRLPLAYEGRQIALHFDGINYRANIWLNGLKIADAKQVVGTFRLYELDITTIAKPGGRNTLAVEVFPPQPDDLALTWVDWNPTPPDKNMGIWHDVFITTSGPVTVRHAQVIADLDLPSLAIAHLTVGAELTNKSNRYLRGLLRGSVEGIQFSKAISLAPNETRSVQFTSQEFRQLNISHPRLWWPSEVGPQHLHTLELEFQLGSNISDYQTTRFGIRTVTSEVDKDNHRLFKVNGKNILIRGGGWASDMLLRYRPERLDQEFRYVKDMHLNAIRLEGKLESDYFYELADRYGILILAGWCCCDHWEHWQYRDDYKDGPLWDQEDLAVARYSLDDQIRRLRAHPSLLVWMNGSDHVPPPHVEQMYIDVLEKNHWPNPYLSSASANTSAITGVSGVKMEGSYQWVPPAYWLLDKHHAGAFGFATETSPGPAVPPLKSLRLMLPADHLWPVDDYWSYHAGGGRFTKLDVFTDALNNRYGKATSVEDYAAKSQLMTYEAQRAMFEAYGENKYKSTGVIQWMLNNAWPSLIWHLYDYYLRPGGGYYGTKKACEPVHVQYSYDDRSIVVVNSTYQKLDDIKVTAKVFDLGLLEKYSNQSSVTIPADGVVRAFVLPPLEGITPTYFLKLTLEKDGKLLSSNFYWLSSKDDLVDWDNIQWYYTPTKSFADFTALQKLKPIELRAEGAVERRGDEEVVHVTLNNPSRGLAFAVHLQITKGELGDEVLPVLYDDNYFALMPGEKRVLTARYNASDTGGRKPSLLVSGWNVIPKTQPLIASTIHR